MEQGRRFIGFFFLIYIANMCASGAGYTLFYLSKSLGLMGSSSAFTLLALDIARLTTIICLVALRQKSDQIAKHKMGLLGAWLTFCAFFGLAFSSGSVWILIFCLLFGVSAATPSYLAAMMFDRTDPTKRLKIFGYFATSYSLSSLVGALLTQILYPIGVHGQTTGFTKITTWGFFNPAHWLTDINPSFMLFAGCLFALLWAVCLLWAQYIEKKLPFFGAKTQEDKNYQPRFIDYKTPMSMTLLLGIVWMSLMSLVPSYSVFLGLKGSSYFFTGFGLLALLGRFFILPYAAKIGRRTVVYVSFMGYVLSLGFLLALPYVKLDLLLLLAGMSCGLGHGILYTMMNIFFTEVTPKHTGNATFVFIILFQWGCLLVLPLGLGVDLLGYPAVFIGLLVLTLVFLALSLKNPKLQKSLAGV